jgi:hypothetical protein
MNSNFNNSEFYKELESSLHTSTFEIRKIWVTKIIDENIPVKELIGLLNCEKKTANRFLWLLSEIGLVNQNKLLMELPFLLDAFEHFNPLYKTSLASYWLIAGVPQENEGKAIDILFQFLLSANTNVTIKARSMLVLFKLTIKYPELKNELTLCLKDQMDKYSFDFKKRVSKILIQLEK